MFEARIDEVYLSSVEIRLKEVRYKKGCKTHITLHSSRATEQTHFSRFNVLTCFAASTTSSLVHVPGSIPYAEHTVGAHRTTVSIVAHLLYQYTLPSPTHHILDERYYDGRSYEDYSMHIRRDTDAPIFSSMVPPNSSVFC